MRRSTKLKPKPKSKSAILLFDAIGTAWSIELYEYVDFPDNLRQIIVDRIELFDRTYSRFRNDSWITRMSQHSGTYDLPPDALPLLNFYDKLYAATAGLVTPLIGRTLSDAGYDAEYSFRPKALKRPPDWPQAVVYSDTDLNLTTGQPVLLDFGAAGKGYLIDIIGDLLEAHAITAYCIDAGGDIRCRGNTPVKVGLENPGSTDEVIGIAEVGQRSICGSAGNRRRWGDYNHIINPKTLKSPKDIAATWIIAKSTMLADGLATAVFFKNAEMLRKLWDFEYAIMSGGGELSVSKNFPAEFFIKK